MDVQDPTSTLSDDRARAWFDTTGERLEWLADRFPAISLSYSDSSLRSLLAEASDSFVIGSRTAGEGLPTW